MLSNPAVIGQMKYDPVSKRWLGNDEALLSFDCKPLIRPTLIPHTTYTPQPHSMTFDPISCKWIGNEEENIFIDIPLLEPQTSSQTTLVCEKFERDGFVRSETRHKLFVGGWYPRGLDRWSRDTSKIHLYEIRSLIK